MPVCQECGAFVTSRFARVFGDNEDDICGCRQCLPIAELAEGRASRDDA